MAVVTLGATTLGAGAASAATSSAKKACNGPELKFMTVNNLTATIQTTSPEVPPAVQAAAKQITDSCQLGGPVTILSCDYKFTANDTAACARQAVDAKVVADVGSYHSQGDAAIPILSAAGIPQVGNGSNGAQASTSPFSFPTFNVIPIFESYFTMAKGVGSTKPVIIYLDLPSVKFFVDIGDAQAKNLGMTVVDRVAIPVTATDMAQFAARVVTSGADSIMTVLGPGQIAPLVKSMIQQGIDTKNKVHLVSGLNTITPDFVKQLGPDSAGILTPGSSWTPDDTSNPAVKRFLKELKAAKLPHKSSDQTMQGLNAWGAMHLVADMLEGEATKDSATLIKKLNAAGPINFEKYGTANVDFTKPAFPADPTLSKLRIFQSTVTMNEVNNKGKVVPLSKKFVSATTPVKLKLLKL